MKRKNKFPPGWDEAKVRAVLEYYEGQGKEDTSLDKAWSRSTAQTTMTVPTVLVPAVRRLILKHAKGKKSKECKA